MRAPSWNESVRYAVQLGLRYRLTLVKLSPLFLLTNRREMHNMALSHSRVGMTQLMVDHRHRHGAHSEDRFFWVCRSTWNPIAGLMPTRAQSLTHGTQLLSTLPSAPLIALEKHVARRPPGD